jgi:hypothetical protein
LVSLPNRCINGVRLVSWNIGSLPDRFKDILALHHTHGADIVCLQNIGNVNHLVFHSLRQIRGLQYARIFFCPRPGNEGGGVAFVALNPLLRVWEVARNVRGGMAITVAAPGFAPFAITTCYFPPVGCPFFVKDTEQLLAWIPREASRQKGLDIALRLIAGSWNESQGCIGRHTADPTCASSSLVGLQLLLTMSPALGRTGGNMAATFTARAADSDRRDPEQLSELDGFWCCDRLASDRIGSIPPDERPKWSSYFRTDDDTLAPRLPANLTHLPVFLDIQPNPKGYMHRFTSVRSAPAPKAATPGIRIEAEPGTVEPSILEESSDVPFHIRTDLAEFARSVSASAVPQFDSILEQTKLLANTLGFLDGEEVEVSSAVLPGSEPEKLPSLGSLSGGSSADISEHMHRSVTAGYLKPSGAIKACVSLSALLGPTVDATLEPPPTGTPDWQFSCNGLLNPYSPPFDVASMSYCAETDASLRPGPGCGRSDCDISVNDAGGAHDTDDGIDDLLVNIFSVVRNPEGPGLGLKVLPEKITDMAPD